MALSLDDIRTLYRERGQLAYSGEPVTQLEHALQSAQLAEQAGAETSLVVAAFLHDLGHLLNPQGATPTARGIDDLHQYYVLPFLRGLFPAAVLEPIRLHVDAKRCLCALDPNYYGSLSPDSVRSLALQGGIYDAAQAAAFTAQPYAEAALRLRCWDDLAKVASQVTPPLEHYLALAATVAQA